MSFIDSSWESIESVEELRYGDRVFIDNMPYSQKYLDPIWDHYFQQYEGIVASRDHYSLETLSLRNGLTFETPINYAGESAITIIYRKIRNYEE